MTKLISKYQSGGTTPSDNEIIMQYLHYRSPNYKTGKFLGERWNTRYDGKVEWNGDVYPKWMFVEPEWYKQITEPSSPLTLSEIEDGYKTLSRWFSSLFNQNQQPKQNSTAKEPKERPGIGKKGDR